MMDMSLTDKEDINGGIFLVLVESTSIGSSSTANVEFRFLGAVFITGLFSSHCLSSLVTRVTVSFKLVGAITSAPVGLSGTVSNVSLRLETEPSTALGVGGIVTVCLSMGCPGCCSFNFCWNIQLGSFGSTSSEWFFSGSFGSGKSCTIIFWVVSRLF